MDIGINKWRGIYFNLEKNRRTNSYVAYFVHNNIAKENSAEEIGAAINIAKDFKGLSVNYNPVQENSGLFYWEYERSGYEKSEVMDAVLAAIDAIRDMELGDIISKVA
ncbi:hypothetical protein AB2B38_007435 [Balneola sp. MJW-20]|uniref:hypothetical protein n=1 Tax=Gracilimonas aurantiaca TaxID=3234185 RepID=UPI003466E201